jgi:hypothetical protein
MRSSRRILHHRSSTVTAQAQEVMMSWTPTRGPESERRRRRIAIIVVITLAAAFVVPVLAILFG